MLRLPGKNDDRDLQNDACATKTATHLVKTTQTFRTCHTEMTFDLYQAGWNVTKCRACQAKQHDNLLGNLREGEVLQLPT